MARQNKHLFVNMDVQCKLNNTQFAEKSINDLIDKDEYASQYVRIDNAISILKTLGSESLICKTDIVDAFKKISISQEVHTITALNEGINTSTGD